MRSVAVAVAVTQVVLFLSLSDPVSTQANCECMLYFYCTGTTYENQTCTEDYDVCCDTSTGSTSSEPPATEPSTVSSVVTVATEPSPPRVTEPARGDMCGLRGNVSSSSDPGGFVDWKLVDNSGGDTSTIFGEFPWMVAVMKVDSSGRQEFLCGGSIIYPHMILTTAHSVRGYSASQLIVKAGVWDTTSSSETSMHQDRAVSQIVMHPGFDKDKVANDVALLMLRRSLTPTNNVAPICLPSTELRINTAACLAIGWGGSSSFGNNKNMQSILKKVNLPLVDYSTCQNRLRQTTKLGSNFNLHNSFICAGGDKGDTCLGDGGGPLMCATIEDPSRFVQVGITSWGVGCAQGPPGVYASVQAAADWIQQTYAASTQTNVNSDNIRVQQ